MAYLKIRDRMRGQHFVLGRETDPLLLPSSGYVTSGDVENSLKMSRDLKGNLIEQKR
ncbi:hypothetical protein DPMN_134688 [Dreissena polymorpha]|uniref:Uncharacterized protein n=1 Tax=Dreissena polymorpha TaxID=45954 RepID=A0A9D4G0D1_DREPO|nr:hypothetical protein DPMN_134688 [Dreissena polymorpha]